MKTMSQSDAVYEVVTQAFKEKGFVPGDRIPSTKEWDSDIKWLVYSTLLEMFKRGWWVRSSGPTDEKSMIGYIHGLVNNQVRKDPRLNGNVVYLPTHKR